MATVERKTYRDRFSEFVHDDLIYLGFSRVPVGAFFWSRQPGKNPSYLPDAVPTDHWLLPGRSPVITVKEVEALWIEPSRRRSSGQTSENSSQSGLRTRFQHLAQVWRDETRVSSSTLEICTHWAYQQIIGLGPVVVPLVLEEVERGERHWSWALAALTGENPAQSAETQQAAADAWLQWSKERELDLVAGTVMG